MNLTNQTDMASTAEPELGTAQPQLVLILYQDFIKKFLLFL